MLVQWHCELRQARGICSHMHEHVGSCILEQTSRYVLPCLWIAGVAPAVLTPCVLCVFVCAFGVCHCCFPRARMLWLEPRVTALPRAALHDTFRRIAFKHGRSVGSLHVLRSPRCTPAQLVALADVPYVHPHVSLTRFDHHL
jgi:hypothetical protein